MSGAMERRVVITELHNRYQVNGFITEDDALAYFIAHNIPLSEIDAITEQLLNMGVLIKYDGDSDEDEIFSDRSKLDYNEIFKEVLDIAPGLETFIKYVKKITPPQLRESQNLIPQAQSGNRYARDRLIEMYLRTIIKQALYDSKRYMLPLEDTIQDGVLGIMIAIRKYDPSKHEKFSTYAPWWINQSISRTRRLFSNLMYFPVHLRDKLFLVLERTLDHDCVECWNNHFSICPALVDEICHEHGFTLDDAEALVVYHKQWQYIEDIGWGSIEFSDYDFQSEMLIETADASITSDMLAEAMGTLTDKEKRIVRLRYGFDTETPMTLEEVGNILGVTRERIRQIEAKALRKLNHPSRSKKYHDERSLRRGAKTANKKQ